MIITLILIALFITSFMLFVFRESDFFGGCSIVTGLTLAVIGMVQIISNCPAVARSTRLELTQRITSLNSTYEILYKEYKENSNSYVFTAIEQYNSDVTRYKVTVETSQMSLKNPWISWFVCHAYKEFSVDAVSYINLEN